jgi:hypothetical protein
LAQEPLLDAPSATVQASQAPEQALLQHTPSAQNPLEHSPAAPQLAPRAFSAVHFAVPASQ